MVYKLTLLLLNKKSFLYHQYSALDINIELVSSSHYQSSKYSSWIKRLNLELKQKIKPPLLFVYDSRDCKTHIVYRTNEIHLILEQAQLLLKDDDDDDNIQSQSSLSSEYTSSYKESSIEKSRHSSNKEIDNNIEEDIEEDGEGEKKELLSSRHHILSSSSSSTKSKPQSVVQQVSKMSIKEQMNPIKKDLGIIDKADKLRQLREKEDIIITSSSNNSPQEELLRRIEMRI